MFKLSLLLSVVLVVGTIACASSATSPTNLAGVAITVTGTGVTTYTYTKDIAPIMASDCVPCHGNTVRQSGYNFSSVAGVLAAVTAGSENSVLVKVVQPAGPMYTALTGDRTGKVRIIYDWVVSSKAAQ